MKSLANVLLPTYRQRLSNVETVLNSNLKYNKIFRDSGRFLEFLLENAVAKVGTADWSDLDLVLCRSLFPSPTDSGNTWTCMGDPGKHNLAMAAIKVTANAPH